MLRIIHAINSSELDRDSWDERYVWWLVWSLFRKRQLPGHIEQYGNVTATFSAPTIQPTTTAVSSP